MNENYLEYFPFADSNYIIPAIGLLYLVMVKVLMEFMRFRDPYRKIKPIIILYNLIQIFANGYILISSLSNFKFVKSTVSNFCGLEDQDEEYTYELVKVAYIWCLLKISDFLDTMFFILLKKFSHVSFLHVYHHYTTMMVAFLFFKFIRTEQATVYAGVNCFIHVVMYFYYFLTSLGIRPSFKKLVTRLQLLQFGTMLIYSGLLLSCQTKPIYIWFSLFSIVQCVMYIALFLNFYIRAYNRKKI